MWGYSFPDLRFHGLTEEDESALGMLKAFESSLLSDLDLPVESSDVYPIAFSLPEDTPVCQRDEALPPMRGAVGGGARNPEHWEQLEDFYKKDVFVVRAAALGARSCLFDASFSVDLSSQQPRLNKVIEVALLSPLRGEASAQEQSEEPSSLSRLPEGVRKGLERHMDQVEVDKWQAADLRPPLVARLYSSIMRAGGREGAPRTSLPPRPKRDWVQFSSPGFRTRDVEEEESRASDLDHGGSDLTINF